MFDQDIQNFQEWFKRDFGIELTREQAVEKRLALVNMMRIVYKPVTEKQLKEIQEWRKQRNDLKKIKKIYDAK